MVDIKDMTLEEKCLFYRKQTDYKLLPNSYVLVMLDGRSFSKVIKNKFKKPFDDDFIDIMNKTAKYLCENIQGCKLAYVQSDEISLILTDLETPLTDRFFDNRICKLQSIIASMATAKFNQLMLLYNMCENDKINMKTFIENQRLMVFDCKCWNVPTYNDVFAWFLFRQIDCVRNSKQQAAQTYICHKKLQHKNVDEQIQILLYDEGIDWNQYSDGQKYGRFIIKEKVLMKNIYSNEMYYRNKWFIKPGFDLTTDEGNKKWHNFNVIPHKQNDNIEL